MTIERVKELVAKANPPPWTCEKYRNHNFKDENGEPKEFGRVHGVGWASGGLHGNDCCLIASVHDIARLAIELSEEIEQLKNRPAV